MEEIKAPFTDEQVKNLNTYQEKGRFHPFTCIGQMKEQKDENGTFNERTRSVCPNDGKLIATKEGWVCPCGEYKQDWAHAFMAEPMEIVKEVSLVLTEEEINSPLPIEIKFHVHSETDPKNEDGVTYTIKYPKK